MNSNENINEKNIQTEEPLRFFLDGSIDETIEDVVTLPRDEYDEMVSEVTILRVIETLVRKHADSYHLLDFLRTIIDMGEYPDQDPGEEPAKDAPVKDEHGEDGGK